MELSLRLSFYVRHSLGGYTVGTTVGFPVETMEALVLLCHCQIPQKYPQYHMNTYLAHRRLIGSGHPLDEGLGDYYQGLVPRVPWATNCSPKFWT
jgi:hypothetical protein